MSYSAVGDFSGTDNPDGVWSYGYTVNGGETLFTQAFTSIPGFDYWNSGQPVPDSFSVGKNVSGSTVTFETINDPANYLWLDPETAASVDVTFTAPAAGTYSVTGSFLGIDTNEQAHDVEIYVNGTPVFDQEVDQYDQSQAFNLTETLAAGSTVEFAVDTGFSTYEFLSTGLSAIVTDVTCFVTGTRITTPTGETPVEQLIIGDIVQTLHAGFQAIKWIGTRSYDGRFVAGNRAVLPIRIKSGAIADNVPARELWVSPGHALCIDGFLVQAGQLVNGVSITQSDSVETITYYHIELPEHEIVFAENCPAETFLGESFRALFQNAADYKRLYPGHVAPEQSCLPQIGEGFVLDAIRGRLAARAGIDCTAPASDFVMALVNASSLRGFVDQAGPRLVAGWAQDESAPETPVCLDIRSGGVRIARVLANRFRADLRAAGLGSGCHGFEVLLPAGIAGPIDVMRSSDRAVLPLTAKALAQAA